MVDLEAMRFWAGRLRGTYTACDDTTADYLEAAALELAEHRRAPVATGPSVADRLDRCRDRASRIVAGDIVAFAHRFPDSKTPRVAVIATEVETLAHAMLRAEREPEAGDG